MLLFAGKKQKLNEISITAIDSTLSVLLMNIHDVTYLVYC